jgi:hypothetical protein
MRRKRRKQNRWQLKQDLAAPSRYYGDGGTQHGHRELHVEVHDGEVVAVWFRCQLLPFREIVVDEERARSMRIVDALPQLTGVEVLGP